MQVPMYSPVTLRLHWPASNTSSKTSRRRHTGTCRSWPDPFQCLDGSWARATELLRTRVFLHVFRVCLLAAPLPDVHRLGQASHQDVLKLFLTTSPDLSAGVEVAATARVVMAAGWAVAVPVAREASLAGDWAAAIVAADVEADLGVAAAMAGEDVRETAAAVRTMVEAAMAVAAALASDWAVAAAMAWEDLRETAAAVRTTVEAVMAVAAALALDWAVAAAMVGEDERDAAATVRATVVAVMALATVVAVMALATVVAVMAVGVVAGATEAVAAVE